MKGIHQIGVALALWERSLPADLARWVEGLAQLPEGHLLAGHPELRAAVASIVEPATRAGPMADRLVDDVCGLARLFLDLTDAEQVDLRLEAVDDDACAAFHRDCVGLRLITTYRGPGTEWVAPGDAEYALRAQGDCAGAVHAFPEHSVGVFRGCKAQGIEGLVHRSPRIGDSVQSRLLLCLNTPTANSPPCWTGVAD